MEQVDLQKRDGTDCPRSLPESPGPLCTKFRNCPDTDRKPCTRFSHLPGSQSGRRLERLLCIPGQERPLPADYIQRTGKRLP